MKLGQQQPSERNGQWGHEFFSFLIPFRRFYLVLRPAFSAREWAASMAWNRSFNRRLADANDWRERDDERQGNHDER